MPLLDGMGSPAHGGGTALLPSVAQSGARQAWPGNMTRVSFPVAYDFLAAEDVNKDKIQDILFLYKNTNSSRSNSSLSCADEGTFCFYPKAEYSLQEEEVSPGLLGVWGRQLAEVLDTPTSPPPCLTPGARGQGLGSRCSQRLPSLQAFPAPAPSWPLCPEPAAVSSGRGLWPRTGPSWSAASCSPGAARRPLPASSLAGPALSSLWTRSQVGCSLQRAPWARGSQGYTLLRGQLALPGGSESGQEGRHGLGGREESHSIVLPSSAAAGTWGWGSQLLPTRGAGAGARPGPGGAGYAQVQLEPRGAYTP